MKREDCVNMVNTLMEWELITRTRANKIMAKRDKLYGDV